MVRKKSYEEEVEFIFEEEVEDEVVEPVIEPEPEPEPVAIIEPPQIFVQMATSPRIGDHTADGPVTGDKYHINSQGTGDLVDLRDALKLKDQEIPVWCFKTQQWIKMKFLSILK